MLSCRSSPIFRWFCLGLLRFLFDLLHALWICCWTHRDSYGVHLLMCLRFVYISMRLLDVIAFATWQICLFCVLFYWLHYFLYRLYLFCCASTLWLVWFYMVQLRFLLDVVCFLCGAFDDAAWCCCDYCVIDCVVYYAFTYSRANFINCVWFCVGSTLKFEWCCLIMSRVLLLFIDVLLILWWFV